MKSKLIIFTLILTTLFVSCTHDFENINKNPNAILAEQAGTAKYFLTHLQYRFRAPRRFPFWRASIIHADRYAGHTCFGNDRSYWDDEMAYTYHSAYTDASWKWLADEVGQYENYLQVTAPTASLENKYMYATGQIMKASFYQVFTDMFGEIPFSEAGSGEVLLPKYDTQAEIYVGLIALLNEAMATIGDATVAGTQAQDLSENDLYFGGDLQKWKKYANTLKLRIALRAYGAEGASFADGAVREALAAPLLSDETDNVLIQRDNTIDQVISACYGDVWYNFLYGSSWMVSKTLIDYLQNNSDPRLSKYAKPALGGTDISLPKSPENSDDKITYILDKLTQAGVAYTRTDDADNARITMAENSYYVGQPSRLNQSMKAYVRYEFFSTPAEYIIQRKYQEKEIFPAIVMLTAESYFLQAEAAVRGLGGGDATALFKNGISQSMKLWEVADADIESYLANATLAQLTGTTAEKLEKIAIQRWIADYTDGVEAWSVVRKSGYPSELAQGVSDYNYYGPGTINGDYPQRLRYGNSEYAKNSTQLQIAIDRQGADAQNTKLWWAK